MRQLGDEPLEDPVGEVIPPLHHLVHQEILLQSELQVRHLDYGSRRVKDGKVMAGIVTLTSAQDSLGSFKKVMPPSKYMVGT